MASYAAINDPAVWTASTFKDPEEYTVQFSAAELEEMDRIVERIRADRITIENVDNALYQWPLVTRKLVSIYPDVKSGRGFVILGTLPADRYSKEELGLLYWGFGQTLGKCASQSSKGDRLGHIRDMSATDPGARAYQNRYELNPHTDFTDIVCLLCLRDAKSGGETPLASALHIHNEIARTRPDLLEILYRGFRNHRRGEEQPGEDPITPHRVPVFSNVHGNVSLRFVRPYIEAAAAELGEPLAALETEALDLVQDLAERDENRLDLRLTPGTVVMFNNYTVIHSRRPFVDHDEEDKKRHLLRMWVLPENFRETAPEIEVFSTKGEIQKRETVNTGFSWGVGGR